MGLQFFPRGGSAHVARNLARCLPAAGWDVRLVSGSGTPPGDARAFYDGIDVVPVDMTKSLAAPEPLLADPPMHPSYEDRDDAPDRVFAELDDRHYDHQVDAWCHVLRNAGAAEADVLHLHHLTPLNEAAARVAPDVPVVGHLHGTELLMLEAADDRWPHFAAWAERMRTWAQRCERLILLSDSQVGRVETLLGADPDRCVTIANGFDPEAFDAHPVDRAAFWQRQLGEAFTTEEPVLLYVGRFTAVKRVPLLIEAYARARPAFDRRAPLVLLGGYPGEWEGEHPLEAIARTGAEDIFLAGWHGHDELPGFLVASDAVVLPSVREQFGQVLVEGMACGLPAIAVDAHGPAAIVEDGRTGWLVPGDDAESLAAALVEAVNRPDERARRGREAYTTARELYAWPALAADVAEVYAAALTDQLSAA